MSAFAQQDDAYTRLDFALIRRAVRIDVVAFGCTSASMVIGEAKVCARIHEARAGVETRSEV